MLLDLDLGRLWVFIGGFLLFFTVETLLPRRQLQISRLRRLGFHAAISIFNAITIRAIAYVPFLLWAVHVEEQGWGISRWLGLVGWFEILASVVVLDFFDYVWHRANHRVRFLWRFHKAHHSDIEMDVTTALRFHPGELLISAVVKAGWIAIWGPTVVAWFVFEVMISICAQFHHTNIDLPDRVDRILSWVIVSPRFHASHHAVDRRWGDANFSTIFSFWDRLFGSYSPHENNPTRSGAPGTMGLPEGRDVAFSLLGWLKEPIANDNLGLPSAIDVAAPKPDSDRSDQSGR